MTKQAQRSIPGAYYADEEAIVYDMNAAYAPVPKGGRGAAKKAEDAAAMND